MMRTAIRLVVTTFLALAASFLPIRVAGASPEIEHARIDETEIGVEDFCGLTVDIRSEGTFTTQDAGAYFQAEVHAVQTITNEANGHVVYVEGSNRQRYDNSDNGHGTSTLVVTFEGMNSRIYTDHSSILMRVVGFVSVTVTVDADDNVIDHVLVTHGQYDDRDSCDAIVAAIG